jgi:hypothetical protein
MLVTSRRRFIHSPFYLCCREARNRHCYRNRNWLCYRITASPTTGKSLSATFCYRHLYFHFHIGSNSFCPSQTFVLLLNIFAINMPPSPTPTLTDYVDAMTWPEYTHLPSPPIYSSTDIAWLNPNTMLGKYANQIGLGDAAIFFM